MKKQITSLVLDILGFILILVIIFFNVRELECGELGMEIFWIVILPPLIPLLIILTAIDISEIKKLKKGKCNEKK